MAKGKKDNGWNISALDRLLQSQQSRDYGSTAAANLAAKQQQANINAQYQAQQARIMQQLQSAPPLIMQNYSPRSQGKTSAAQQWAAAADPSLWWGGNSVFVPFTPPSGNNKMYPDPDEQRRKKPDMVQYLDLKPGDKVNKSDSNYNPHIVTRVDRREGHIVVEDSDGDVTMWRISDRRIVLDRIHLLERAKGDRPKVAFSSVILPDEDKQAIQDAIGQIDNYDLIFDTWGFGDVLEKGRAVSLLFYGVPGTGKTLMAQAIADKYDYELKVISTAEIESSEPGQAERNIKAYFDAAAKNKNTVLLFDECDSLIADRRGIGMILGAQVNALLTCLENFEGIAIFTTNRLEKMDEAFNRRLSLKLKFEMPDQAARVEIWKRMYPDKAPLAKNIDWDKIASVEITGGYIKNVVLRSARRAAASKAQKITNQIIIDALIEEVETLSEFQDAVDSSNLPRLRGGGQGVSVERTTTMSKVVDTQTGTGK